MALYVTNTLGNICTRALQKLNAIGDPNSVPADDMEPAAQELQSMLRSWAMEGATIWMRREVEFSTVASTAGYDLSTNTISTAEVVTVTIFESGDDIGTPITPLSRQQYLNLSDRTTEGRPVHYWTQFTYNDEDITFWPVPDAIYDIKIDYKLKFTNQDERTDALEIPDYMIDAAIWNLAARLLPDSGQSGTPRGNHIMAQARDLYLTAMAHDVIQDGGGDVQFYPEMR